MTSSDPFGLSGQLLDGQFRIDHFAGEGGFSVVYRGTHVGLGEPIAVKCLKLPAALGSALVESFIKRFRSESRLHYKLSQGHLHIARSIASGTTVAPATSALVPYTVLEWLDGRSLAEELDDRRANGLGGRPLPETVKLLDSAVDALAYAHAQGVVHRDLNPSNLFFASTRSGTKLKVLDFGVAKIMADSWLAMGAAVKTLGNVRIFTPAYGAPEQFDERVGSIGPWTDVYAVALVVLEVLTGRTIMEGDHLGELAARAMNPQRPTPRTLGVQVGDEVEAAMARAIAVAPEERPRDAGEFWGLLKHAMAADASSERSPAGPPAPQPSRPAPTVRMPEGVAGSERASPIEPLRPAVFGGNAFGGTLRMLNAPGTDPPPRPTPSPPARTGPAPAPASAAPAAGADWSSEPIQTPKARAPVIVMAVLAAATVVGLAAAWLLR